MVEQIHRYIGTLSQKIQENNQESFTKKIEALSKALRNAQDYEERHLLIHDFEKDYANNYHQNNNNDNHEELFDNIRKKYFVEELHKLTNANKQDEDIQRYLTKVNPKKHIAYGATAGVFGVGIAATLGYLLYNELNKVQKAIDAETIWIEASKGTTEQIDILTKTSGVTPGYYETVPGTPEVPGHITSDEAMLIAMVVLLAITLTAYILYNRYEAYDIESAQQKKLKPNMKLEKLPGQNLSFEQCNDLDSENLLEDIKAQKGIKQMADHIKKKGFLR